MKKTLIALSILTTGAYAVPAPLWSTTGDETPTSYTISNLDSFSVAITLDIDTLKSESGSNFNGSAKIIDLTGSWNTSNLDGTLDINVNGNSTSKTSTLYIGSTPGKGDYKSNYSLTGISGTNIFTSSTNWTLIDAASLVFVKDGSAANDAVYAYFTLKYTNGTSTVYEGSNTGIKFTIDHDDDEATAKVADTHFNVSTITFANGFATSAQVYSSALSATDAKAVGAALIPEPTTATLSLLALAGLAARRRRR